MRFERAIQLNPASYKAHCDLGEVLGQLGRTDDAIRELRTATELKPDGPEARYKLGLMLRKKKEESAAKQQFEIFERLEQQTKQKMRSEERRVGKSVDLGGRRIIKKKKKKRR